MQQTTFTLLLSLCALASALAQTNPPPATIAEIEALRAPYLKTLAALQSTREARSEPVRRSYLTALDRLEKESASRPELDPGQTIKAERERTAARTEPGGEDRKAMVPALSALRVRYESDLQRAIAPHLQQEQQLARQYVSSLDTLQRRLTAQNQIQKAALVSAERESVAASLPGEAKAGRVEKTPAESTVRAEGKLDPALAAKIAATVSAKAFTRSDDSGGDGEKKGSDDVPDTGALLAGFEFFEVAARDGAWIRSLRPYFLTREGVVPGKDRGKMEKVTKKILARPGYAVAGLLTLEAKALQVVFMKIDPATGRFDPAPAHAYKSTWIGTKTRGTPKQLGGDGRFIIGVYGKTGANCDTIGLVEMN